MFFIFKKITVSSQISGGGGGGDFIVQEDTVFVSGMNPDLTEEDIADHFGAIGVIKVCFTPKKKADENGR